MTAQPVAGSRLPATPNSATHDSQGMAQREPQAVQRVSWTAALLLFGVIFFAGWAATLAWMGEFTK